MRESMRTEKMHLPTDSTELWLEWQKPRARQRNPHMMPPKDPLEAWIERRVEEILVQKVAF